jgi:hypothetical protein
VADGDFSPDDQLALLRAQLDQAEMLFPLIGGVAKAFFDAMSAVGFNETQALYLAAAQLHSTPGRPA